MDLLAEHLSVLIIKPDAFDNPSIYAEIKKIINAHRLEIERQYQIRFSRKDIFDIWPRFSQSKYRITGELLQLYMTSGLSEVLIVRAANIVEHCIKIRSEVRERFGSSALANCIHTPTEDYEIISNIRKLNECIPNGLMFLRHIDNGGLPGLFGRLKDIPFKDVQESAHNFWNSRMEFGWKSVWLPKTFNGTHEIVLFPGDPYPIDYGMSVIAETLVNLELEEIIALYIEAEVQGFSQLVSGTEESISIIAEQLLGKNLKVEVRKINIV